jgi:hypothetical protein
MDPITQRFVDLLHKEIDGWEEEARYWEDPRIFGIQDINGSTTAAKDLADRARARAKEHRGLIKLISN